MIVAETGCFSPEKGIFKGAESGSGGVFSSLALLPHLPYIAFSGDFLALFFPFFSLNVSLRLTIAICTSDP